MPYPPTAATPSQPHPHPHPGTPSPTPPAPDAGAPAATTVTRSGRDRRTAVVLVAGVVVLALAPAGLTYAPLDRGDGAPYAKGTGDPVSSPARAGDDEDDGGTPRTDGPTPSPTASESEEEERSAPPPQTVSVTVTGARTEYAGSCPPARERAPAFTATFTVGRLPAEVSYRWVAEDGSVDDPGRRKLSFPEGVGRTKHDTVTVTTYAETGTHRSGIGVEVRDPVRTASETVPFSVTCEPETPADGVSASPSGSDDGY
ncbi:hypothetical protein ACFY3N_30360 [Streptomyces sp. NPDC000348]|uniref:hypothetical protein n=1 Tax=Streptomyces sp. NPDC000348 TaxID=3364538 RepID=UPI0036A38D33